METRNGTELRSSQRTSVAAAAGVSWSDSRLYTMSGIIVFTKANCSSHHHNDSLELALLEFKDIRDRIEIGLHLVAFLCNLLSLVVFCRRDVGGRHMTALLMQLTIAETIFTGVSAFPEFLEQLNTFSSWRRIYFIVICKIISHACLSLRNWWIVLIGVMRYLVLSRPFRMRESPLRKVRSLWIIFVLLTAFWLGVATLLTFLFKCKVELCADLRDTTFIHVWYLHEEQRPLEILEGVVYALRTVIPVIIVSICCIMTIHTLVMSSVVSEKTHSSATRTIVMLTVAFAVLEFPLSVNFIFCFVNTSTDSVYAAMTYYRGITELLVSVDSLCNMMIYCAASRQYRVALVSLFSKQGAHRLKMSSRRNNNSKNKLKSLRQPPGNGEGGDRAETCNLKGIIKDTSYWD